MKVTVSVNLEPGYRPGIYALGITALWNDGDQDVAQRDLLYDVIGAAEPTEDTDIRMWVIALMRAAAEHTEQELLYATQKGQAILTLRDFKPLIC